MYNKSLWTSSTLLKQIEAHFGITRLQSGTAEEWNEWAIQNKRNHPIVTQVYRLIDELQVIWDWPCSRVHDILYYIRYRFIKKTHYAPTYLPPGVWYETDTRLITSMFGLLVDFVEVDKANMQRVCDANSYIPSIWHKVERSSELGLQYLEWESTLTGEDSYYAHIAEDIIDLYLWWTVVRANRVDPYESTGYNEYCKSHDWTSWDQEYDIVQPMLRQIREIENEYTYEDTMKMLQLVRIRSNLRI